MLRLRRSGPQSMVRSAIQGRECFQNIDNAVTLMASIGVDQLLITMQ